MKGIAIFLFLFFIPEICNSQEMKVLCVGDSVAVGFCEFIQDDFSGVGIDVHVDTLAEKGSTSGWAFRNLQDGYDIVIFHAGINDFVAKHSCEWVYWNIKDVIDSLDPISSCLVLFKYGKVFEDFTDQSDQANAWLSNSDVITKDTRIVVVDYSKIRSSKYQIHFSRAGYKSISRMIVDAILSSRCW